MRKFLNVQSGFTLLEVIVVLVIAGIVAAMVFTYFGSAFTSSVFPISRLQQVSNLRLVMENITADYNRLNQINLAYKWRSNTYYQKGAIVLPSTSTNNDTSLIDLTMVFITYVTAARHKQQFYCAIVGNTATSIGANVTDNSVVVWKA